MYIISKKKLNFVRACLNSKPFGGAFLFGSAGTGKSALPQWLAEQDGANLFFFQCFPGTREEDLLVKMLPSDKTKSGVKLYDSVLLQAVKSAKKRVLSYLVLDEWDKTRPSSDSFLLDFLQSGRVNFNGKSLQLALEEREYLKIFITMNDERELSEPLLRRLPKIDFEPLEPKLVKQALEATHPNHPYLDNAVVLYQRCLAAGMSKPATIQELRQLLDAITLLGDNANWDSLVYTYVTKTRENHLLLKEAEEQEIEYEREEENPSLNPEAYEVQDEAEIKIAEPEPEKPKMPRLKEIIKINEQIESKIVDTQESINEVLSNARGIITLNDKTYNNIARNCDVDSEKINETIEVVNDSIVFKKEIPLPEIYNYKSLWGEGGEIVVTYNLTKEQLKTLINSNSQIRVVKINDNEILLKHKTFEARWQNNKVIEIIANTDYNFDNFVSSLNLDHLYFKVSDSRYDYLKQEVNETPTPKSYPKPVLGSLDNLSELEMFARVGNYILDLHEYLFHKRCESNNYQILNQPQKFDLQGWEVKKGQLGKVKLFYRVVLCLSRKYDFFHYGEWSSEAKILLDVTKEKILIKVFGYYGKQEYRTGSLESLYQKICAEYEKTIEHIKSITEIK